MLYVVFISGPDLAQRKAIDLSDYLSYGSLVVMLFAILTTFIKSIFDALSED